MAKSDWLWTKSRTCWRLDGKRSRYWLVKWQSIFLIGNVETNWRGVTICIWLVCNLHEMFLLSAIKTYSPSMLVSFSIIPMITYSSNFEHIYWHFLLQAKHHLFFCLYPKWRPCFLLKFFFWNYQSIDQIIAKGVQTIFPKDLPRDSFDIHL